MQGTVKKITVDLVRLIAPVLVVLIHTTAGRSVSFLYFISVTIG